MHHLVIAFGQMEPILLQLGIKSNIEQFKKCNYKCLCIMYQWAIQGPVMNAMQRALTEPCACPAQCISENKQSNGNGSH